MSMTGDATPGTTCEARFGADQPWVLAEVGFGGRSLLVQPRTGGSAAWIPYVEVARVEEVEPVAGEPRHTEVSLLDGRVASFRFDDESRDTFLSAVVASAEAPDPEPARPAEFGGDQDTSVFAMAPGFAAQATRTDVSGTPIEVEPSRDSVVGRPGAPSRNAVILVAALVAILLAALVAFLVTRGGSDDQSPSSTTPETTAAPTSAPTTTAPTTTMSTTTTVAPDDPASALAVSVTGLSTTTDGVTRSVYVDFDVSNLSDRTIVAYELEVELTTQTGAEPATWVLPLRCASEPLAPGAQRTGTFVVGGETEANLALLADCSVGGWPVDLADPQQAAVGEAVARDLQPESSVQVTSVTFEDGSTLTATGSG